MKKILVLTAIFCFASLEVATGVTFEKMEINQIIDTSELKMIRQGDGFIDIYLRSEVYRTDSVFDIYLHKDSKGLFGDDEWINSADYINGEIAIGCTNGLYFFDEDFNLKRKYTQKKDTLWDSGFCGTIYNENRNHYVSKQCYDNLVLIDENNNLKQSLYSEFFIISAIYDIELIGDRYYISCADSPGSLGTYSENIFITDQDFNILDTIDFNLGKEFNQNTGVQMYKLYDYMFYSSLHPKWTIVENLNTNEFYELDSENYNNIYFLDMMDVNDKIIISTSGGLFEFNKSSFELESINIINNIDNEEPTIFHDLEIIDGYCYAASDKGVYRANLSAFTSVKYENQEPTQLTNGRITNNGAPFNIKVYNSLGEIIYSNYNVTDINLKTQLNSAGIYFVTVESDSDLKVFKYLISE